MERKRQLAGHLSSLIMAAGVSQSELARRMQDYGWNYSQMTVSRSLKGERTIGAIEHQDLLRALGLTYEVLPGERAELAELRAFKADVLRAVGGHHHVN